MITSGYTKLFGSIIHSTIWRESKEVKIVWITMLAMANKQGIVEASLPALADAARVTLEECIEALKVLSRPDQYSRSKEYDGRRVEEAEGGWVVLNHGKYRDRMGKEDRLEYQRVWQAEYRKRRKGLTRQAKSDGAAAALAQGLEKGPVLNGEDVI